VRRAGLLAVKLLGYGAERLQQMLSSVFMEMTFDGMSGRSALLWIGVLLAVGLQSRCGRFCAATLAS